MYQILCDGYPLFDPRDEDLQVLSPKVKLEANTVGEGSFTILPNHPYFDKLKKLKSVFEVRQDADVVFRGRMTNDSQEFDNRMAVDLEGALACTNDTIIPPFDSRTIKGKNLLQYPYSSPFGERYGCTISDGGNSAVILNGKPGTTFDFSLSTNLPVKANITYTFSINADKSGAPLGILQLRTSGGSWVRNLGDDSGKGHTFRLSESDLANGNRVYANLYIQSGQSYENLTIKPMLEEGARVTKYAPPIPTTGNAVKNFLMWILEKHNDHAESWQELKLGNVTVTDPNNTLVRSSEEYASTWETLRSKLFESSLGGFLNVRYEPDGNYLDYLADFELTNTQRVTYGENLLDLTRQSDATETYSAIMPFGAQLEDENGNRHTLDLSSLPDGNVTDDVVKEGLYLYSKSAVATYGWICVPIDEATWQDVTVASNLQSKAVAQLTGTSVKLSNTIELKALDLHLTDEEIQSFRVCRNLLVDSLPHDLATVSYQLLKMDIDIMNPQNTTITAGTTVRSLTDVSNQQQAAVQEKIEKVVKDVAENRENVVEVKNQVVTYSTEVVNTCNEIILSAMTDYVETGNFEKFQQTVEAQLKVLSDSITMKFTETTNDIKDVNGDLQSKFNQLYKYIEFSGDTAITISSGDSTMTLEIDNESGIVIKQNGVQLGRWCGDTFESGNIIVKVNERAQFGDFAFIPRADGSLQFLKVGG